MRLVIATGADWIVSRVAATRDADDGAAAYHIDGVIPPDEYAVGDDSVYTNYVSSVALAFAVEARVAREKVGTEGPGRISPLLKQPPLTRRTRM